MGEKSAPLNIIIVAPVYNDWDAVKVLIGEIDSAFKHNIIHPSVILINDGSSVSFPDDLLGSPLSSISNIDLLSLRRNIGHQRAIAIALTYIFKSYPCDAVIVMDADGEDRPEDIIRLVNLYQQRNCEEVIFAERKRRMEGLLFIFFYRCYQVLHKILTGHSIKVGNFSIIPFHLLSPLVVSPELWNHYAASIYKLRLPYDMLATARGERISGKSKMNFISLVIHGLSAISVFGEIMATRILFAACGITAVFIFALVAVILIRLFTDLAVPGWATFSSGLLLVLSLQILATTASFLFFVLNNRNLSSFIPLRDFSLFIERVKRIYSRNE